MNLALGALIIITFLMPGAAFIKGYYSSLKRKQSYLALPLNDLFIKGILVGIILHLLVVKILILCGKEIKFMVLYSVIQGKELKGANIEFSNDVTAFLLYTACITILSYVVAKVIKYLVELIKWDIDFYSLRTTNYWYQIFSGRYLEGEGIPGMLNKVDAVFLDIYTDGDIIYSGFLVDFNVSMEKNDLENLVLAKARKRICHLQGDDNKGKQHKTGDSSKVRGDLLIIPFVKVKNINVTYINTGGAQLTTTPVKNLELPVLEEDNFE